MLILSIKTDNPQAELGIYNDDKQIKYVIWEAHRKLAETIHKQIAKILDDLSREIGELNGVVVYSGPGSFTGLRIGITVANSIAYGIGCKIVSSNGENWVETGLKKLQSQIVGEFVMPNYGAPVHITKSSK